MAAEMILDQRPRQYLLRLDEQDPEYMTVEDVKDYGVSAESLQAYQREVYASQGALPAPEVDRLIEENGQMFLPGCGGCNAADTASKQSGEK